MRPGGLGSGALEPWAPEPPGCPTAVCASRRRVPGACRSDDAGVCRRVMGDGELGPSGSDEVRQVISLKTGGQVPVAARAVGRVDDDPASELCEPKNVAQ